MRLIETAPGRGVDARGALWVLDSDGKWKETSYRLAAGSPIHEELGVLEPAPAPIELVELAETGIFVDRDGEAWRPAQPGFDFEAIDWKEGPNGERIITDVKVLGGLGAE